MAVYLGCCTRSLIPRPYLHFFFFSMLYIHIEMLKSWEEFGHKARYYRVSTYMSMYVHVFIETQCCTLRW